MTAIKTFLAKYGHTIVQGVILAGQAYMLATSGGKLTVGNYVAALAQLAVAQHARQSEPAA